jgi:hypothetical protein
MEKVSCFDPRYCRQSKILLVVFEQRENASAKAGDGLLVALKDCLLN